MPRILLVDDDINLLQMVKLMLERAVHEVETAHNAAESIERAAEIVPDLAIIDVMMPGISGYDVVRKLRADPRTARIPIIILTARSQPMDKHMALDAGANAFLSKPVTSQELTQRVDAVLRAGVNYRVHTGLLTEPVPPSSSPAAPVSRTTPPPAGRRPIGADDPAESGPAPGSLPVVTVASLRGGTGSTTVAVNLAFLLASHGRRVCMADLSTTSGHVMLHVRQVAQHHWGHLLPAGDALDGDMITRLLTRHTPSGIAILPAPLLPTATPLSKTATGTLLTELSRTFNHVIVDAPNLDDATTTALLLSRTVVVVMSDDPPSVQSTVQFLTLLQNMGVEAGRVRVALNHVLPVHDIPPEIIQKALKRPLSAQIPYATNQINAMRRGVPLAAAEPDSAYSQAIQLLARTMSL
jgi:CheY-like chemotaxis protein/MinD-like ATPase involved in chromosome partitioning or flagellar assembly